MRRPLNGELFSVTWWRGRSAASGSPKAIGFECMTSNYKASAKHENASTLDTEWGTPLFRLRRGHDATSCLSVCSSDRERFSRPVIAIAPASLRGCA